MARGRRALITVLVAVEGIAAAAASLAGNAASGGGGPWPGALEDVRKHPWSSFGAFTALLVVVAVALIAVEALPERGVVDPLSSAVPNVPDWVVDRTECERVVAAVCRRGRRTVGITTGLHGAGGFGKTTLAEIVWAHPRVQRRFGGRVYRITLGRDVRSRPLIAAKVGEATRFITGDTTPFDDPQLAGAHLGRMLDQRSPILLILDDVWWPEQLTPFLVGGRRSMRLVTTRIPSTLPGGVEHVLVDQLSLPQSLALLTWQLPPLPPQMTDGLLRATGRWPLLVRLTNRLIARQIAAGADPSDAAAAALARLQDRGPLALDDPHAVLDLNDPVQRSTAARATIEAATALLPGDGYERFTELGVFAEDETIPVSLVAHLWHATSARTDPDTRDLCASLADLSLLSLDPAAGGRVQLHDVIRDHLRTELGEAGIIALNSALLDAVAVTLAPTAALRVAAPSPERAWWEVPDGYLTEHLIGHMIAAGRTGLAEAVAGDLRWIQVRLLARGPTAPWSDLTHIPTPLAAEMAADLARITHLLFPTTPASALIDIVHSRLEPLNAWQSRVEGHRQAGHHPVLRNRWAPPDLPSAALLRTLISDHPIYTPESMRSVAISQDSTWLATGERYGTVRFWDPTNGNNLGLMQTYASWSDMLMISPDDSWVATISHKSAEISDMAGRRRHHLGGHGGLLLALLISPDGTWIATASADRTVRIWDTATGETTATLLGHRGSVQALAVSTDGTRLASASADRTVRIWDPATGECTATLTGHTGQVQVVNGIAVSPDRAWVAMTAQDGVVQVLLATSGEDGTVRLWNPATGECTATLVGHTGRVTALAVAPDGTWIASASTDGTVRVWNPTTSGGIATLTGHIGPVTALAVAPDGTWLASAGQDCTARIWNPVAALTSGLTNRGDRVEMVVPAPDGTWFATGGMGVRLWDRQGRLTRELLPEHSVSELVVSPDGTWLAFAEETNVLIRSLDGQHSAVLAGHSHPVNAVVISPDGTWLASASRDEACVWDTRTGLLIRRMPLALGKLTALAATPDGRSLALGYEKKVLIRDRVSGAATALLRARKIYVYKIAFSADGGWLATAHLGGLVSIVDCNTLRHTAWLSGHKGTVNALAFSPDSLRLATVGNDNTLRIWQPDTWSEETVMRTEGPLLSCAWSADGSTVAVGGDKGLYLYAVHAETLTPA